jgi:hypothetical protein
MKPNTTLTDGSPVTEDHRELKENGQQKGYVVLSEEERKKGFVRPVRTTYTHVGRKALYPLRDLTPEEQERYKDFNYVKYEDYPEESHLCGRFWTAEDIRTACNTDTTMSMSIAETYARQPDFYGSTFCNHCKKHFDLEQFVWKGTDSIVGS